jgi:hypothetical protein
MDREKRHNLLDAIETARLKRAGTSFSDEELAADVIAENPELWKASRHDAAIEFLKAMCRRDVRRAIKSWADSGQYLLPGFERVERSFSTVRVGQTWVPLLDLNGDGLESLTKQCENRLESAMERAKVKPSRDFSEQKRVVEELRRLTRIRHRYDKAGEGISLKEALARREERRRLLQEKREARAAKKKGK